MVCLGSAVRKQWWGNNTSSRAFQTEMKQPIRIGFPMTSTWYFASGGRREPIGALLQAKGAENWKVAVIHLNLTLIPLTPSYLTSPCINHIG